MDVVAKCVEIESKNEEKIYYYQTLKGHAYDSLKILRYYLEKNEEIIESFCKKWSIPPETFMKNLFITTYLHDIGKATEQFQEAILENKNTRVYPHAFFGFPIVFELFKMKIPPIYPVDEYPLIEPLAVLSHHTELHNSLYRDASIRTVHLPEERILKFINSIEKAYTELDFEKFFQFNWKKYEKFSTIDTINSSNAIECILSFIFPGKRFSIKDALKSIELDEMTKLKSVFTLFFSIVKLCDSYSSACFSDFCRKYPPEQKMLESVMDSAQEYVLALPKISSSDILEGNSPYCFQSQIVEKAAPYTFLFAPCGRGKTEAALLWAFEICKKLNKNKIIFAMPTQTTSNAIMDRFVKKMNEAGCSGKDLVGLYHGKAFIKLKEDLRKEREEETDELDKDDIEEIKSDKFKGNIFFKPITVTTIDHLILSFVHGFRHADFACGNLQNAVIIFDEIHYYELQTLKHLIDLFKILQEMGIPHLLMSGTLPEFLKHYMAQSSGESYSLIEDEEGLSFTPFRIKSFDSSLVKNGESNTQILHEIQDNYANNLNQFIILNTVRRAQQFYNSLSKKMGKDSIYLIHSQFTYSDRASKESKLIELICEKKKRPLIVVSTQVIEISLDISCDIMYTERAPIDSLGQRAGRLHRKGKTLKENNHEFVMKIFKPENSLPYNEDILDRTAVSLRDGIYSYRSLKRVCDAVYGQEYLKNFEDEGRLKGAYCFLKCGGKESLFKKSFLFGPKYNVISFSEEKGNLFVVRTTPYRKFEVIPEEYYDNKTENFTVENKANVPHWWICVDRGIHGDELQWFEFVEQQFKYKKKLHCVCKLPYDKDYGFDNSMLEKENQEVGIIENII